MNAFDDIFGTYTTSVYHMNESVFDSYKKLYNTTSLTRLRYDRCAVVGTSSRLFKQQEEVSSTRTVSSSRQQRAFDTDESTAHRDQNLDRGLF